MASPNTMRFDGNQGYANLSISGKITGAPFTMACFCTPSDTTDTSCIMGITDTAVTNNYHSLDILAANNVDLDNGGIRCTSQRAGARGISSGRATGWDADEWIHAAGVWASTTSRTAYIDGVPETTNTTSVNPTSQDSANLGYRNGSTHSLFFDGCLAQCAWWNIALSTEDIESLAAGYDPRAIQPEQLTWFIPGWGNTSSNFVDRWENNDTFALEGSALGLVTYQPANFRQVNYH